LHSEPEAIEIISGKRGIPLYFDGTKRLLEHFAVRQTDLILRHHENETLDSVGWRWSSYRAFAGNMALRGLPSTGIWAREALICL
jgi:hypothetical protein